MNNDSLWFQYAVIYELHVRSFNDSGSDGIGDFKGLRQKLPYFADLGVTALWLLPFYPSPLKDDGYDISDYYNVHPIYGTLRDFQDFLSEAHRRGLRVITELVINHTSDQHPWFQQARKAPAGSPERDFYVWSETPEKFKDARIIFKDFESSNWSWDPVANAYYWHRFYSHQPDLNFDSPGVREAVFKVVDYWLGMGVDGLRLDAVPYLFERDGTSCENLPETHAYLKELRKHVDSKFPGRMLLAEANQWPEDAAAYFGSGDECHMEFHFPLMPRLFMAIHQEDRFPIIDILEQTPAIPKNCQWAIFLRNHDELTLEMVTDEERDYMVRIYAQDIRARINLGIRRRLAPLLGNNIRKIEMINSLLLSLPGTPIIYYGDEIGMGDNFYLGDRNGVRTPMQWSADRNAGFSQANPQQLFLPVNIDPEFHYETVNVDVQRKNTSSLFWWMRRVLKVRQSHPAFSVGEIEFILGGNAKVLAYVRKHEDQTILVIANLSRFPQATRLDLVNYKGHVPEELFGGALLPEITDEPYLFTLGTYGFYWLLLRSPSVHVAEAEETETVSTKAEWSEELIQLLEQDILPRYLRRCRWFGAKQSEFRELKITANFPVGSDTEARILLAEVSFVDRPPIIQAIPLAITKGNTADSLNSQAVVARFASGEVLWDALYLPEFREHLLRLIASEQVWSDGALTIYGRASEQNMQASKSRLLGVEQSNTSIVFDNKMVLKFIRRYESGQHPDAEILRALGEKGFPHVPKFLGEIRHNDGREEGTLGILTTFVENEGDGWTFTLDALKQFFENILAIPAAEHPPTLAEVLGGTYAVRARQLGVRTGELHRALEELSGLNFVPEAFTALYQRSLYQTLRTLARRTDSELGRMMPSLSEEIQQEARAWQAEGGHLLHVYEGLLKQRLNATKIRVHGDYHLGQVLNTGKDFVIIDFEGEPRRSLGERLLKRSPLVDVAGMLRSFDYAVETVLANEHSKDRERLRPWGNRWLEEVSKTFLEGYREATTDVLSVPKNQKDFEYLLRIFLLDKAVYEIGYELSYRPDFLFIPLRAARRLLDQAENTDETDLRMPTVPDSARKPSLP